MIREAMFCDLEPVMILAWGLHAEHGLFSLSRSKARAEIRSAIIDKRCFVALNKDAIVGWAAYRTGADWYSDEVFMSDLSVYVDPGHRNTRAAPGLRNALKQRAKEMGLRFISGCVGKTADGARLYAHGFKPVGQIFEMR